MAEPMTRWGVEKMVFAPFGWAVYNDAGYVMGCPTWSEAMDYADRMARTVEVVLPRGTTKIPIPESFEEEKPITLAIWGDYTIVEATAQGTKQCLLFHDDELEPLALALLAAHYKEQACD